MSREDEINLLLAEIASTDLLDLPPVERWAWTEEVKRRAIGLSVVPSYSSVTLETGE